MWKIQLFSLGFDSKEKEAAARVLDRGWLPMGQENEEFEKQFGLFQESKFCLTVNNCTAALHLAMVVAGVTDGDEVIVPSFTFVATANAVRYVRAVPVFGEVIGSHKPILDPSHVESLITPKTKAIIVVHYAGYPCDMDAFMALGRKYGLKVIEDCAHCPGAKWNGRFLGTWGDLGCFSFFSNKNLSMGEGGAILTQNEEYFDRLKLLRSHGMTSLTLERHRGHAFTYDVVESGYNYRLDEIRAAIGLEQLKKLPSMNFRRSKLMQTYRELLKSTDIELPFLDYERAQGVDHIMPIFLPNGIDRKLVMERMKEKGIQTSIHYPCIHKFSNFASMAPKSMAITEDLSARVLTLPLYPGLELDEVGEVATSLTSILKSL